MELIKPGTIIDFMRWRKPVMGVSITLVVLSAISLFVPGPNFGIDFAGGTEVQVKLAGDVPAGELRETQWQQQRGDEAPLDEGELDRILQFTNIARPRILGQCLLGVGMNRVHLPVVCRTVRIQEMTYQQIDISFASTQRRKRYGQHI